MKRRSFLSAGALALGGMALNGDPFFSVARGRVNRKTACRVFQTPVSRHWRAFCRTLATSRDATRNREGAGSARAGHARRSCHDRTGAPESRFAITDTDSRAVLASISYSATVPLQATLWGAPISLPRNDLPKLNMKKAVPHSIDFRGGDAGPPTIGRVDGREIGYREMLTKYGLAWTVNSYATHEESRAHEPILCGPKQFARSAHVMGKSHTAATVNRATGSPAG